MPFAHDRDLLILEPTLFRDVGWAAQRLFQSESASLSGTTLSVSGGGADFAALAITTGHVVILSGAPLEVLARLSPTSLTVSRPRASDQGPPIPPGAGLGPSLSIATFLPQIGVIHEQILRALGVEPSLPARSPQESDILNPRALARLEALGALHLIFASAAAMVGDSSPMWARAALHRQRFAAERATAAAEFDLDHDGAPDSLRRLSTHQFIRS